ncbi:hypothetical protein JW933_03045 [candidate division FCPU426 bacterium]|nr:hypothetical protein [candidate division FCPU426 bacterium]
MTRVVKGILVGAVAGIIDVLPMLAQKLSWDANLSAFCFWVVTGLVVATADIDLAPVRKGIVTAFLLLIPSAILIGAKSPVTLIPIVAMTFILGAGVGWILGRQ